MSLIFNNKNNCQTEALDKKNL